MQEFSKVSELRSSTSEVHTTGFIEEMYNQTCDLKAFLCTACVGCTSGKRLLAAESQN